MVTSLMVQLYLRVGFNGICYDHINYLIRFTKWEWESNLSSTDCVVSNQDTKYQLEVISDVSMQQLSSTAATWMLSNNIDY